MSYLEAEIRRLEGEFNMFFAGRLPRPPYETKNKVAALIKRHDQSFIRNTADRFRFEMLQTRYQKLIELTERQINNRELGRPMPGVKRPQPSVPVPKAEQAVAGDNVIRVARDQPVSRESGSVQQLFEKLSEAKKQVGESPLAIDRLAMVVKAQVDKFAAQGKDVAFKIAVKDGKVTLTAKAADEDRD